MRTEIEVGVIVEKCFRCWDVEGPAELGLPWLERSLQSLGCMTGEGWRDWSGLGCQAEGLQQGWGCWVWGVTGVFGVPGWRGSQQDLECWAGGGPGGILGLLMGLGSQAAASNLFFCFSVATHLYSLLPTGQVSFSLSFQYT